MDPYYVWPPLAVALLVGITARRPWRFVAAAVLAGAVTVYAYHRTGPWMYWVPIVVMLAVTMALVEPAELGSSPHVDDRPDVMRSDLAPLEPAGI
jgi:hypothetical protein